MVTLVERLRAKSDQFYRVRDRIGFKKKVYILTRTWMGRPGVGMPTDVVERVIPNPGIRNLAHRRMVTPNGQTITGDIVLTGIAFNLYNEQALGNAPMNDNEEKFFLIDGKTYSTSSIEEKMVSREVVLIKTNKNLWRDDLIPTED